MKDWPFLASSRYGLLPRVLIGFLFDDRIAGRDRGKVRMPQKEKTPRSVVACTVIKPKLVNYYGTLMGIRLEPPFFAFERHSGIKALEPEIGHVPVTFPFSSIATSITTTP